MESCTFIGMTRWNVGVLSVDKHFVAVAKGSSFSTSSPNNVSVTLKRFLFMLTVEVKLLG